MIEIVAGIDAGGTKTRAFAIDRAGEIVGRGAGGGGNLLTSPDPQGSIMAALTEALAGRGPQAVVLSCAGGDRAAERERGRAILGGLVGPGVPIDVTHDAQAALYAGDRSGCGVVLIAGTGSIAYGRNAEGDEDRAGGWGHLIGDEGSAYWIGVEGLRAAAHAADGRGAPTSITANVLRELGLADMTEVLPRVYGQAHPALAIIAAARAVATAAAANDAIAVGILRRGANALARSASVVAMSLGLSDGPIYLAGGAFEQIPALAQHVRMELLTLLPRAAVEPVKEEPAMGAARLAARLAWGAA
ncbi:MAG: N-acetylglucosamine kinase [Chloroflexi bacterium]|nr:N-acetylglucosamine kinase [Chloroflexota bacterium]